MARSLLPEKCGRPRLIGTPACPRQRTFRQLLRLEHGALDGAAGVDEAFALAGVLALAGVGSRLAGALTLAGVGAGAGDLGLGGGREGAYGEDGGRSGSQGALGHDNLPQWRSNALMPLLPVYARGGGTDQRRRSRFGENKGRRDR